METIEIGQISMNKEKRQVYCLLLNVLIYIIFDQFSLPKEHLKIILML